MDPLYSLTGLLVGFLVGLTGMGGGALMTPILILLVGVPPTVAVGSDMAYSAITKVVGGWQHKRQKTVNFRLVWQLALGSVPGGLLAVWCVHSLQLRMGPEAEHIIVRLLGLTLILVAAALFVKSSPRLATWRLNLNLRSEGRRLGWAVGIGFTLGFLVGLTSIGSGSLFGVLLLVVFGLDSREMVGTDVFHAAILTTALAGANAWAANINYGLVGSLLVGSVPGVLIGSRLAVKLPEQALRPILASVLLLSGLKML